MLWVPWAIWGDWESWLWLCWVGKLGWCWWWWWWWEAPFEEDLSLETSFFKTLFSSLNSFNSFPMRICWERRILGARFLLILKRVCISSELSFWMILLSARIFAFSPLILSIWVSIKDDNFSMWNEEIFTEFWMEVIFKLFLEFQIKVL